MGRILHQGYPASSIHRHMFWHVKYRVTMAQHQDYWCHLTDDQLMTEYIARHKDQQPLQELEDLKNTIEYGCSEPRLHPRHQEHSEEPSKEAEKRIDDDFQNLTGVLQAYVEEHRVLPYCVILQCLASRYLGGGLIDPTYKDEEYPYRSSPQFSLMFWNLGNWCRNRFDKCPVPERLQRFVPHVDYNMDEDHNQIDQDKSQYNNYFINVIKNFGGHLFMNCEAGSLYPHRARLEEAQIKTEVDKGKGKGKDKLDGDEKQKPKCKFYLTDGGCRKGKECGFSHDVRDEKRRCYTCGSVDNLSPSCTRSRGPSSETSPTKPRMAKVEGEDKGSTSGKDPEVSSQASSDSAVKDLLEEANKMLRSLSSKPSSSQASSGGSTQEDERKDVMERLQQQLKAMKAFKMRRLATGADVGLVDSGATHALRPRRDGENVQKYPLVDVGLADGRAVRLRMAPGGSMIAPSPAIEPIVPMGQLTEVLGCQIVWSHGEMQLRHPEKGDIPIQMKEGCPHLAKSIALDLIAEIEDAKVGIPKTLGEYDEEVCWMKRLVEQRPVLSSLPEYIKEKLVVCPGEWSALPGNRHQRKRWRRDGMMVHLFAGPDSGFTLKRALRQLGGPDDKLLEVDLKRGPHHDVMTDEGVYAGLIRAAIESKILVVVAGPNCRTRSLLRHVPIPGQPNAPRPIRRWGGEEFGVKEATEEEIQKLHEDDIMMWRCIFLFMLSTYMRRARKLDDWVAFGLEQPASPREYMPEVVSFWDTQEWKAIAKEFALEEITFKQGTMGGASPKPTTFGGNLELNVDVFQEGALGALSRSRAQLICQDGLLE